MRALISEAAGVKGRVKAPPSKSYTHRAFVISGLADGSSRIIEPLLSDDTFVTLNAMKAFGAEVERQKNEVLIRGTSGKLSSPRLIDCRNSGTSLRLLTGVSALDSEVTLTGDTSLQSRPIQPLLDALAQLGVNSETLQAGGRPPVRVYGKEGRINNGRIRIKGDMSSQFISSLLIISPYVEEDVIIEITTPLKSQPYIDITLEMMKSYGAVVENINYREFIVHSSRYKGREFKIEGDYSSASYFIALAAMSRGKVEVGNLISDSLQGDKRILSIVEEMGAKVEIRKNMIAVEGRELSAIEVDLGDTPDLLPTVAILAAVARGKSIIRNVEHARYKESDRIRACSTELRRFGCRVVERRDGLEIEGKEKPRGASVKSYSDHRMVMALSILGLVSSGETVIDDVESVAISYPEFFDDLKELVGDRIELSEV